jgi:alpha-galactosidase
LSDSIRAKGLKFGIYTQCNKIYQREEVQAKQFAGWNVDFLKVDYCYFNAKDTMIDHYVRIRNGLRLCGRPMHFNICGWGTHQPYTWADTVGHSWRIAYDISNSWGSVMGQVGTNKPLAKYAGPGHWNDPDMLEVGNGALSNEENKSHLTLWCMMAAPLMLGNDVRSMTPEVKTVLTNKEIIALDQDSLGVQGAPVRSDSKGEVWVKPLAKNCKAVVLFNPNSSNSTISVTWSEVGWSGSGTVVRDLWAHQNLNGASSGYSATIPGHGCVALRLSPPAVSVSGMAPQPNLNDQALVVSSGETVRIRSQPNTWCVLVAGDGRIMSPVRTDPDGRAQLTTTGYARGCYFLFTQGSRRPAVGVTAKK